uniref:Regulatory protein E2 n=1 Tax=Human papillomavirus 59 TaxID=37115 RepID=T2A5G1_HPV59|nr:E2 [human papillomavirus 59]
MQTVMDTLSQRLSVLQDQILEHYENDSKDINEHINYWKLVRMENVILFAARENNIHTLNHQVVPTFLVSKNKACEAIELQMALESLAQTEFKNEQWTMQETCQELWQTAPKKCFKKQGITVEVRFDCSKENTMHYTSWTFIYYVNDVGQWCKTTGNVDFWGLYYKVEEEQVYYVKFIHDAKKYGTTDKWEVHYNGKVIDCYDSMCSTSDEQVSTSGSSEQLSYPSATPPEATYLGPQTSTCQTKTGKRPRQCGYTQHPQSTSVSVDHCDNPVVRLHPGNNPRRHIPCSNTTPIIHLKGDKNGLKCLRYRLRKVHWLFENISSTWHWTGNRGSAKTGILTLTYTSETQRNEFLDTVKIPNSVQIQVGYMSV